MYRVLIFLLIVAIVVGGVLLFSPQKPINTYMRPTMHVLSEPLPELPTHSHVIGEAVEDHGHGVFVRSKVVTIPQDIWISDIQPTTVGAPFSVVHHMMLNIIGTNDPLCTNLPEKVLVVGMDNDKRVTFPPPYGYFLKAGTQLQVVAMLHNPEAPLGSGISYDDVSAGFELFVSDEMIERTKPVHFYMLGVEDPPHCEDRYTFTVPPNTASYIKESDNEPGDNNTYATFKEPGTIIGMGSHTHGWQGGRYIDVLINGTPFKKFISTLQTMTPEVWVSEIDGTFIPIQSGDTITLKAQYINESGEPVRGAMGILGLYFSPNTSGH